MMEEAPHRRLEGGEVEGVRARPAADRREAALVREHVIPAQGRETVQRARYIPLETMAGLSDDPLVSLPAVAA